MTDAESHDIKIFTRFGWNPILEISIKNRDCEGNTNMRGRLLMKVNIIAIYNCPVILRCFLV